MLIKKYEMLKEAAHILIDSDYDYALALQEDARQMAALGLQTFTQGHTIHDRLGSLSSTHHYKICRTLLHQMNVKGL